MMLLFIASFVIAFHMVWKELWANKSAHPQAEQHDCFNSAAHGRFICQPAYSPLDLFWFKRLTVWR